MTLYWRGQPVTWDGPVQKSALWAFLTLTDGTTAVARYAEIEIRR